eukprot:4673859-Prymnesium_polylepis.1
MGCTDAKVVVLGMGAFAVELMRTSFERGAAHVAILARQRGTVAPQVLDWLRFVRPFDNKTLRTDSDGDALVFSKWQSLYDGCTVVRPECWAEGIVKPNGHTLS